MFFPYFFRVKVAEPIIDNLSLLRFTNEYLVRTQGVLINMKAIEVEKSFDDG